MPLKKSPWYPWFPLSFAFFSQLRIHHPKCKITASISPLYVYLFHSSHHLRSPWFWIIHIYICIVHIVFPRYSHCYLPFLKVHLISPFFPLLPWYIPTKKNIQKFPLFPITLPWSHSVPTILHPLSHEISPLLSRSISIISIISPLYHHDYHMFHLFPIVSFKIPNSPPATSHPAPSPVLGMRRVSSRRIWSSKPRSSSRSASSKTATRTPGSKTMVQNDGPMFYAMYNSSWWYNVLYIYILYTKLGVQRWYNDTIIKCILRHTKAMIHATAYGMMDLTHKSMMDVQRHRTGTTADPDGSGNTKWPGASNREHLMGFSSPCMLKNESLNPPTIFTTPQFLLAAEHVSVCQRKFNIPQSSKSGYRPMKAHQNITKDFKVWDNVGIILPAFQTLQVYVANPDITRRSFWNTFR